MDSVTVECGPTSATFTNFNSSTMIEAYSCGKQQERYRSGAVRSVKLRSAYIILLVAFFLQIVSCKADDNTNEMDELITIDTLAELETVLSLAVKQKSSILVLDTNTILSDLKFCNVTDNIGLAKRQTCRGVPTLSMTERQIANLGTWWSPWYPVSCCYYCDLGPTSCTNKLGYGFSYSWSITVGSGMTLANINAMTSYSLERTYLVDLEFSCEWKGGDGPSQMWYQQQVFWADTQKRTCAYFSDGCKSCGSWSKYYRANAPIKGRYNLGCSVGSNNVQCDAAGASTCYKK